MNSPTDICALTKNALQVLRLRQPIYFGASENLLDDLRHAYAHREAIPIVYEALLRDARTAIAEHFSLSARCVTLQLTAIHTSPSRLWDWPAMGSDSSRLQRRLTAFLLPLVLREVHRTITPVPGLNEDVTNL